MSHTSVSPFSIVTLSTATYSTLLGLAFSRSPNENSLRTLIKAVSAGHASVATSLALVSLHQPWTVPKSSGYPAGSLKWDGNGYLDDSRNPIIQGQNTLANFVTAWEAGYLIYDTGAMLLDSRANGRSKSYLTAITRMLQRSPVVFVHHILLIGGLLLLQAYIVAGREKGLEILMTFVLMNASTPLLHLRWWLKRTTGRKDARADAALAFVFAVTRFGGVYWVMKKYGQYHNLNSWEAFRRQRLPCQAGTGLLTVLNALWWLGLLRQSVKSDRSGTG